MLRPPNVLADSTAVETGQTFVAGLAVRIGLSCRHFEIMTWPQPGREPGTSGQEATGQQVYLNWRYQPILACRAGSAA